MYVIALGSIGLGLVWGWLIGNLRGQKPQLWQISLPITVTTLIFATEVTLFANWRLAPPCLFLGTASFSSLLHLVWRCQFRHRLDHLSHPR